MNLKTVFDQDFIAFYGISTKGVSAICTRTVLPKFDLSDEQDSFGKLISFGSGDVSFEDNDGEVQVLWYNNFINQCTKPRCFQEGRLRCDVVMAASMPRGDEIVLLEITTEKEVFNLDKPITKGRGFPGGKNEKSRKQLYESLVTILSVESIRDYANTCSNRVCLMGYNILDAQMVISGVTVRFPNRRFMKVEESASPHGTVYSCPEIESFGFKYMRISHTQTFCF